MKVNVPQHKEVKAEPPHPKVEPPHPKKMKINLPPEQKVAFHADDSGGFQQTLMPDEACTSHLSHMMTSFKEPIKTAGSAPNKAERHRLLCDITEGFTLCEGILERQIRK